MIKYIFLGLVVFAAALLLTMRPEVDTEVETPLRAAVVINENTPPNTQTATFAGGCFWCIESVFQETEGVSSVISGYAGGEEYNPTYEEVYTNTTGHREAVRVYFDSETISYQQLLEIFWRSIDPTDSEGQFVDRGYSYTTAVFYEDDTQRELAQQSKLDLEASGRFDSPIVTPIVEFSTFYQAEDYHQDFYLKSSGRYKSYTSNSGRDEFKAAVWEAIQTKD